MRLLSGLKAVGQMALGLLALPLMALHGWIMFGGWLPPGPPSPDLITPEKEDEK